jgi:hypothetical protein
MNSERPDRVSVIDPISLAIDRVKLMLFSPFDLNRWFVIGFCAWLACLGPGGGGAGGGPRYNVPGDGHEQRHQIARELGKAKDYVAENLYWIAPVAVTVVILAVVVGLVLAWLNSRGRFMFLHCVATDRAEIKIPWQKFRRQGNSLFLFRIILGLIGLFIVALPIVGIIALTVMLSAGAVPTLASIPVFIVLGLTLFVLVIMLFLVRKFTFDFVVPIMFLRTVNVVAGWREFMTILSVNKFRFTLYLLFQILISIVIGAIIGIGVCVGFCLCCASCLLLIPYIGTVILLPLLVFERSYSLYYLQQFGPPFDVFRLGAETVPSTANPA